MINYLLYGLGIGLVSTFIYAILNENQFKGYNNYSEYGKICCIIMIVSILILFITSGNSNQSLIKTKESSTKSYNNSPPF